MLAVEAIIQKHSKGFLRWNSEQIRGRPPTLFLLSIAPRECMAVMTWTWDFDIDNGSISCHQQQKGETKQRERICFGGLYVSMEDGSVSVPFSMEG